MFASIMELDQLLERFGKDTGLGQLTMDEADTCTFLVDDMKVSLMHIAEGEHLLCYADVGELSEEACPALALAALKANYLFRGTAGATLAVRPESSTLFLNQSLLLENLSYDDFIQVLSGFVDTLANWKKLLSDYRPEAKSPENMESLQDGFLKI